MFKPFVTLLVIFASLISMTVSLDARIIEISALEDIADENAKGTLYLFDLDDTIIDSAGMLGTKAWRAYILEATKNDPRLNWHDYLSYFIAQHYPVRTVEHLTSDYLHRLQDEGAMILGFTARERNMWYGDYHVGVDKLTEDQLLSMGVDFNKTELQKGYEYIKIVPQYYGGILFADTDTKGEFLLELFKDRMQLPKKVIFVDDKLSQIEAVEEALDMLGVQHDSYWYRKTEAKSAIFSSRAANLQLYYLWFYNAVLTDAESEFIAEQLSEETFASFLQLVLEDILTK